MTTVNLVFPYFNCPDALYFRCGLWMDYPERVKDALRVVVVDDYSQKSPAYDVLKDMRIGVEISLYRIKEDRGFNVGGAKNLGMKHAISDWVILTDADHAVPTKTWEYILYNLDNLNPNKAYKFPRIYSTYEELDPHPDSWLLTRDLFWGIGGYDEDYTCATGGSHMIEHVKKASNGFELLPPSAKLIAIQKAVKDSYVDQTKQDQMEGRMERDRIICAKRNGKMSAKPINPIRFNWEQLI